MLVRNARHRNWRPALTVAVAIVGSSIQFKDSPTPVEPELIILNVRPNRTDARDFSRESRFTQARPPELVHWDSKRYPLSWVQLPKCRIYPQKHYDNSQHGTTLSRRWARSTTFELDKQQRDVLIMAG